MYTVYTTAATSGRKLQTKYYYYLHGPLKRVELGNNLQGIDYVYTAQGALKSINHPTQANDPGKDGTVNSFSPDAFGMTLEYFSGDYTRGSTNISSLATGGTPDYSGGISAQSWRSQKPNAVVSAYGAGVNNPAMVTYAYDDKYQFDNNKFGAPNFGSNSFTEAVNANREHGMSYDANGNILSLNRTNAAGTSTANFSYNYQANTNKLSSVSGYASYAYDVLGQMSSQVRTAGSQGYYVNYDVNGKVSAIYSDAAKTALRVSFAYDESGNRVRKTDHILSQITYYVYDGAGNMMAVYDNKGTTMQQKEVPVYAGSRVGSYVKLGTNYQYELTDHLGNVRAVINEAKQGNGSADVVYYSDYYPFGSPLTLANNDYRYGYQGQFAEVDKETGWNNFDLRMYDPAIGRWMSTDPYEQYYSPYVGMGNNPVSSVDPDGGEVDPVVQLKEVTITPKGGFWSDFGKAIMRGAGNMFRHIYNNPNSGGYGYSPGMKAPDLSQFAQYQVNWGDMIDPTKQAQAFAYDAVYGFTGVISGDGARTAQALPAFVRTVAIVGSASRGLISEIKIANGAVASELRFSQQQVWKKFGSHYKELGLSHSKEGMESYLKIAKDIHRNPAIKRTFPEGGLYSGETWMFSNGNLLRLDPKGNFRSLYPILGTSRK